MHEISSSFKISRLIEEISKKFSEPDKMPPEGDFNISNKIKFIKIDIYLNRFNINRKFVKFYKQEIKPLVLALDIYHSGNDNCKHARGSLKHQKLPYLFARRGQYKARSKQRTRIF